MTQKREKPFTPEEFELFKNYCYVMMGLHSVGDLLNKHTFIDGDAVVKQVRQALATIEKLQGQVSELAEELDDAVSFMQCFENDEDFGDEGLERLHRKERLLGNL